MDVWIDDATINNNDHPTEVEEIMSSIPVNEPPTITTKPSEEL